MQTQTLFETLYMPTQGENSKLPILLDFSLGRTPDDFSHAQVMTEIIEQTSHLVDGLIMMPRNLPDLALLRGKEIWVRVDWISAFNPALSSKDEVIVPLLLPNYWDMVGISGMVSSLLLGNSASLEADNIQYLAVQRSHCSETGIPMVIDLHVLHQNEHDSKFVEIMEMGLTLAVELGCDAVIVPGGEYLSTNKNIGNIVELPILARMPLEEGMTKSLSPQCWKNMMSKVNGIVLTDTINWHEIIEGYELLLNTQEQMNQKSG